MSAAGLDVFDKTLQATNIWLDEIMRDLGPDRQLAWKVLSVVLHTLRDRLPVELAAHLGAQLPLLIRGAYYDQYQPAHQPNDGGAEDFVARVAKSLSGVRPVGPEQAVRTVFAVLSRHVSEGQISNVRNSLPGALRRLWESAITAPQQATEA